MADLLFYSKRHKHFYVKRPTGANKHVGRSLKSVGFEYSKEHDLYFTGSPQVAKRSLSYVKTTKMAEVLLDQVFIRVEDNLPVNVPSIFKDLPSNLSLRPYQVEDVRFIVSRNRSYMAVDPGLGKTIEAIVSHNVLGHPPIIYLCPPFLVENVAREVRKWSTANLRVHIATAKTESFHPDNFNIVPDSMMCRHSYVQNIRHFAKTNHDAMLVIDEAHRYKSAKAERSIQLFRNLTKMFKRVVCLSGTPMPNNISELFMPLARLAPETISFMNFTEFGKRYCDGKIVAGSWDFSGASNTDELFTNINVFLRRRKKADCLKDLPPKTEEIVPLQIRMPPAMEQTDFEIQMTLDGMEGQFEFTESFEEFLAGEIGVDALELATYRKELGLLKVPHVAKYVRDILTNTKQSVLLFAHHREVVLGLVEALKKFKPSMIYGGTPTAKRQAQVDRFQNGDTNLFIGNIQACGVGYNLTAASRVVLCEADWTPGNNSQAIDRAHRIGQRDHVLAQYLVVPDSLDERVLGSLNKKKRMIDQL